MTAPEYSALFERSGRFGHCSRKRVVPAAGPPKAGIAPLWGQRSVGVSLTGAFLARRGLEAFRIDAAGAGRRTVPTDGSLAGDLPMLRAPQAGPAA